MPRAVSRRTSAPTAALVADERDLVPALRAALADARALDPVLLDLRPLGAWVDGFILCHGTSARHLQTIADKVREALERATRARCPVEGVPDSGWVLVDGGALIVHIFDAERREFYDLERLWGDAPRAVLSDEGEDVGRRNTATAAATAD